MCHSHQPLNYSFSRRCAAARHQRRQVPGMRLGTLRTLRDPKGLETLRNPKGLGLSGQTHLRDLGAPSPPTERCRGGPNNRSPAGPWDPKDPGTLRTLGPPGVVTLTHLHAGGRHRRLSSDVGRGRYIIICETYFLKNCSTNKGDNYCIIGDMRGGGSNKEWF